MIFRRTAGIYAYPTWLLDGATGLFVRENESTPPANIDFGGGRTFWVHYEDLKQLKEGIASLGTREHHQYSCMRWGVSTVKFSTVKFGGDMPE